MGEDGVKQREEEETKKALVICTKSVFEPFICLVGL